MQRNVLLLLLLLFLSGCGGLGAASSGPSSPSASQSAPASLSEVFLGRVLETDFQADFSVVHSWSTGYQGEIRLTYRGRQALSAWNLGFDLPAEITSIWNAQVTTHSAQRYRVIGQAYNSDLLPGQVISIGFVANFSGEIVRPTSFQLDGATPASAPPPSSAAVRATFQKDNDWGSGFVGAIVIKNETPQPLSDWVLQFRFAGGALDSLWNGVILSQSEGVVRVGPAGYNRTLAAGQEIRVGFQGHPGNPSITDITVATAAGAPPPTPTPAPTPPTIPPVPAPTPAGGLLHTEGARILDEQGQPVLLRGINWFGMETNTFCPHGLWARSVDSLLDQVVALGYNCLRLPFSNELLRPSARPNGIDYALNPDLQGKSGLEILDIVIEKAGRRGLKVILDRHRPDSSGQSELWYDTRCSEAQWLADWEMLARRYRNQPAVVACDLHNEPHGAASWGDGNQATDWRLAAERAGNRILAAHPGLLIVVEGTSQDYWWGGSLTRARQYPVRLSVTGRLVYSAHDYPGSVFPQSWFQHPAYPANLNSLWDAQWGYLAKEQISPVLLGEFGTHYNSQSDRLWLQTLVTYLSSNSISCTYWCLNPNSGDTGGILQDDWRTVNSAKQQALQPLLSP